MMTPETAMRQAHKTAIEYFTNILDALETKSAIEEVDISKAELWKIAANLSLAASIDFHSAISSGRVDDVTF